MPWNSLKQRSLRQLASGVAATILLVTAVPSDACAPPSIQFGLGSARLDAHAGATIDEVVGEFRARRGARVQLRATTDGLGPAYANMRLARRRGDAVKAALVRRGIPANAIDVVADGEEERSGTVPEHRVVWLSVEIAPSIHGAGRISTC